jgi:hypothetical protein
MSPVNGKDLNLTTMDKSRRNTSGFLFGTTHNFETVKSPLNAPPQSFEMTATQIPPKEVRYDPERLTQRPGHKVRRYKFDSTKTECHLQKNNDPQTM